MNSKAALCTVFFLAFTSHAASVELRQIAGHKIEIVSKGFENSVVVDGKILHTNAILSFDELIQIEGTVALIGDSSFGGNACPGSPFIVSFPSGGAPRFDGPLDKCAIIEHVVESNKVTFRTRSVPGREIQRWEWTPSMGFSDLAPIPFTPDQSAGWGKLRERQIRHPSEIFANGEISKSIKQQLGTKFDSFQELMAGVGSGEFKGDDYVGTSCRPHACMDEAGMIFLSARDRKVYVAWKPEGAKIIVFPSPVKQWPEKAKDELKYWAQKWD